MTGTDNHVVARSVHDLGPARWSGGSGTGAAGIGESGARLPRSIDRWLLRSHRAGSTVTGVLGRRLPG